MLKQNYMDGNKAEGNLIGRLKQIIHRHEGVMTVALDLKTPISQALLATFLNYS